MNKKGQRAVIGFALIIVALLILITLSALIEPLKDALNNARDTTSLNCLGTSSFNQTDFDDDSVFERLVKRPTCFVTGMGLVYFAFAVIIAVFVWVSRKWSRLK